jgi:hypothetical protein
MSEIVILGGGLLGGAVARVAAAGGNAVTVASRTPRDHPGLWRRLEAREHDALAWVPPASRVVVALGPTAGDGAGWEEALLRVLGTLERADHRGPIVLCGPAGPPDGPGRGPFAEAARRAPAVVRLPPLFGSGDRLAWPLVAQARAQRRVSLYRRFPPCRPLLVDDAARAILATTRGSLELDGPETVDAAALSAAITARFGVPVGRRWTAGPWRADELLRAPGQRPEVDGWEDARFGPRTTLSSWISGLPGPRRRR